MTDVCVLGVTSCTIMFAPTMQRNCCLHFLDSRIKLRRLRNDLEEKMFRLYKKIAHISGLPPDCSSDRRLGCFTGAWFTHPEDRGTKFLWNNWKCQVCFWYVPILLNSLPPSFSYVILLARTRAQFQLNVSGILSILTCSVKPRCFTDTAHFKSDADFFTLASISKCVAAARLRNGLSALSILLIQPAAHVSQSYNNRTSVSECNGFIQHFCSDLST